MITPISKDKHFLLTVGTIGAVLALVAVEKAPTEQVLTFLGFTLAAFMGQSQYGQTKRTIAGLAAGAREDAGSTSAGEPQRPKP